MISGQNGGKTGSNQRPRKLLSRYTEDLKISVLILRRGYIAHFQGFLITPYRFFWRSLQSRGSGSPKIKLPRSPRGDFQVIT